MENRHDEIRGEKGAAEETAHKFQGDERDLIVFSPVVARGIPVGATGFLKSQGNIFNVGVTRARGALVVVGDAAACASSEVEYLSAFARYVADHGRAASQPVAPSAPEEAGRCYPAVAHPERVSEWEKVFYAALVDAGLRPIPQLDVDQYDLDFALIRSNGRDLISKSMASGTIAIGMESSFAETS